jgi:3-oxoacyl-[acyl-carrier protein] reductase
MTSEPLLSGKIVVVTGGTGGLGRAMCHVLAREGAIVGVHARELSSARALADELEAAYGRPARTLAFDLADEPSIRAAVETFAAEGAGIDGWIDNAAIVRPALLVTSEEKEIRDQVDINLVAPMFTAKAVLPVMMRKRKGVLLHVSSVAAAAPVRGQAVYAATKGGLESLTRALAAEYGKKGIRVLCLRPGPMETSMLAPTAVLAGDATVDRTVLHRTALPTEVAEMAAFLLSDRCAYATGSVIAVDGGWGLG